MNITYIIGTVLAIAAMLFGMILDTSNGFGIKVETLTQFADPASIFIVVVCTLAVIVASFPASMLKNIHKHFSIMLHVKRNDPLLYIDQLVDLATVARKNGLLALEEKATEQEDPFFKQAIMLIVDANDPDKVHSILMNDIEVTSGRHDLVIGMYEKASAVSPAFGMVGTLIGLIKMLNSMDPSSGGNIGKDMSIALITTLYGCILAHVVFTPIATNLRMRDEEEILCRMIIVEGIRSIQSGENPKFLKEKLLTFMTQEQRNQALGEEGGGGGGKKKKSKKEK